jgi:hypothetical protein
MNREVHVRFCEGVGVKFPRATRPLMHTFSFKASSTKYGSRSFKGKLRLNRKRECTKMLMGECFRASRMRSSASDEPPGAD